MGYLYYSYKLLRLLRGRNNLLGTISCIARSHYQQLVEKKNTKIIGLAYMSGIYPVHTFG